MAFTFGQVEAVLGSVHRIADDKRIAFASRLKHLQKNGVPIMDRGGRGKAATYTFAHVMQIAAAMEIIQSGIPPQLAAALVKGNWGNLRTSIQNNLKYLNDGPASSGSSETYSSKRYSDGYQADFWAINPTAISDLMVPEKYGMPNLIYLTHRSELGSLFDPQGGFEFTPTSPTMPTSRMIVVDSLHVTREIAKTILVHFKYEKNVEALEADIAESVKQDIEGGYLLIDGPVEGESKEDFDPYLKQIDNALVEFTRQWILRVWDKDRLTPTASDEVVGELQDLSIFTKAYLSGLLLHVIEPNENRRVRLYLHTYIEMVGHRFLDGESSVMFTRFGQAALHALLRTRMMEAAWNKEQ
ncbi:hypothetical protein [Sphingomonas sp. PB4P5]|uniref:hypothetical protein n=1 Tax=Parasphingomonas puruogangriensis TaxID=3096155 RepID=UPI002FC5990E